MSVSVPSRRGFSASQLRAIGSDASETLVAAAAGSGKTSVLTERFFELVRQKKAAPDRIAAITFTEKAAAELAVRLAKRFEEAGMPETAPLLERGFVTTIHGLCRKLLREFPIEAGIDPAFTVIDDDFAVLLRREAMERAFESACLAGRYTDLFAAFRLQRLEKPLDAALSKWRSGTGEPSAALSRADLPAAKKRLEEAMRVLKIDVPGPDLSGVGEPWPVLEALDGLLKEKEVYRKRGEEVTELREAVEEARQALGDVIAAPLVRDFTGLLKEFGREYEAFKASRACMDFDDLLHHTVRLLEDGKAATAVRRCFDAVLVDEYQDVNPLQAAIIDRLAARCGVFYVGDVRQSIYAFRFADCGQFVAKSRSGCLSMDENYRSRPHLIGFVNAVFSGRHAASDIPYGAMVATRPPAASAAHVELLLQPGTSGDGISGLRAGDASAIAARIRMMVDDAEPVSPKGEKGPRPVRFGDIAVLLPQMTDIEIYERALRRAGIPYHLVKGKGFYYKIEVQDVMNALKAVARPDDWTAAMACAKSPLGGLSDDALYRVRRASRDTGFFETLSAGAKACGLSPADAARAERLLAWYLPLRAAFHRMEIPRVIDAVLEATDYDAAVLAMPGGERRYLNLQKIKSIAVDFERHAGGGIERFAAYVKDLSVREAQEQEALLDAAGPEAVSILTVHAAKGLEFPVVFVAGCGNKPKKNRISEGGFVIDDALRITCAAPDPSGDGAVPAASHEAAIDAAFSKSLEEWDRLLYVALTRATDRLICTAAWKRTKKPSQSESRSWLDVLAGRLPELLSTDEAGMLDLAGIPLAVSVGEAFSAPAGATRAKDLEPAPDPAPVARRLLPVKREYWQTLSFTVSEIVGFETGAAVPGGPAAPSRPDIRGVADAAAYGNAYHYALQHVDFTGDIAAETRVLLAAFGSRLGAAPLAALEASVARFLSDPEASRIRHALAARRGVHRELPFLYRVPRTAAGKKGTADDLGFVRGQVDLLYQDESGEWTLIDYKTGVRKPAEHFRQAQLYAFCLGRLLGAPVGRARVYYAESGEFADVPLGPLSDPAFERDLTAVFERLCARTLGKPALNAASVPVLE